MIDDMSVNLDGHFASSKLLFLSNDGVNKPGLKSDSYSESYCSSTLIFERKLFDAD